MAATSIASAGSKRSVVSFGCSGPRALRLFCFPCAGGSAATCEGWAEFLPGVEVCAIELPGRGALFRRPPLRRLAAMVDFAVEAIEPLANLPFALFGHSMGGVTALEVARELSRRDKRAACLIVSSCPPPHLPSRRGFLLHTLPDGRLVEELTKLEGVPDALLRKRDMLEAFLPTIRADLEARETWTSQTGDIGLPILAAAGVTDRLVWPADLAEWSKYTSRRFRVAQLDGGHFFIRSHQSAFLALVHETLIESTPPAWWHGQVAAGREGAAIPAGAAAK
jgi:medium-chain acyl-[acyl-carrier-protein] hydrolase